MSSSSIPVLLGTVFLFFLGSLEAQVLISEQEYDSLKSNNLLHQFPGIQVSYDWGDLDNTYLPESGSVRSSRSSGGCGCYIEPDNTYTLAMQPNDDGSQQISIPFQFCFYGTNYSSLYINNNGNISFGGPYSTFSGVGFPSDQYEMITPFWGDVDTRGIGEVLYKVTNTSLIINWKDVGYFNQRTDKTNSFQLIITNGSDPILPGGNNVAFCYKDMQWTTGEASNGVNGIGGVPATVGANKGDSIDFVQFGRFDTLGSNYDGPFSNPDGVSWLDNQSIYFNSCGNQNVPPVVVGEFPCDTVKIFVGDTFNFNFSVLAPEQNQLTTIQVLSLPNNTTSQNILPGVHSDVVGTFIPDSSNIGVSVLEFISFDNAAQPDTIYTSIPIIVDSLKISEVIVGEEQVCEGETVLLSLQESFDTYSWSTGDIAPTIDVPAGVYSITVTRNGFTGTATHVVDQISKPQPNIIGDLEYCTGDTGLLSVSDSYDLITWSNGGAGMSTDVINENTIWVTVEDSSCTGSDTVEILFNMLPEVQLEDTITVCVDSTSFVNVYGNGVTFNWSNGMNSQVIQVGPFSNDYQEIYWVEVGDTNGCITRDSTLVLSVNCINTVIELEEERIEVYPNPAGDELHFSTLVNGEVKILSALGTQIKTFHVNQSSIIDVSGLSSGVYFLRIEGSSSLVKWLKK